MKSTWARGITLLKLPTIGTHPRRSRAGTILTKLKGGVLQPSSDLVRCQHSLHLLHEANGLGRNSAELPRSGGCVSRDGPLNRTRSADMSQAQRWNYGSIVAVIVLGYLTGCGSPAYQVSPADDGYTVQVPAEIMRDFPEGAEIQVTLEDPDERTTVVAGTAVRLSDNSFRIRTEQQLRFQAAAGRTWLLISLVGLSDDTDCSGCPRDRTLQIYENESICWCWAEPAVALASSASCSSLSL